MPTPQDSPPAGPGHTVTDGSTGTTGQNYVKRFRDTLLVFLPRPFKDIVDKGLLRAFLLILLVFVILPPLVTLLSAFWLKQLASTNVGIINALRIAYLQVIAEGFSIEEVASRSNARLDYFQWFEGDLRPGSTTVKEFRISIQPRQKAFIDIKTITLKPEGNTCTIPETEIDLISISLGGQPIRTLVEESNITIVIGKQWWADHENKFDTDDLVQRLTFKLADPVRQLKCGKVHYEGSIRVFKDLLQRSGP